MRQRAEVQRPERREQDGYGQSRPVWATVATRWAEVLPLSGRELVQAQTVRPDVSHKVTMRWLAGVTHGCRLLVAGQVYEVASVVNPDGRKRFLELTCVRKEV